MDHEDERDIHEAVNAALDELAQHLGGSSDTGGPVENATQIKGRGDLGVLLTDADNRVLGRVWVAFGAAVDTQEVRTRQGGAVHVQAEVCSEVIDPPVPVEEWASGR